MINVNRRSHQTYNHTKKNRKLRTASSKRLILSLINMGTWKRIDGEESPHHDSSSSLWSQNSALDGEGGKRKNWKRGIWCRYATTCRLLAIQNGIRSTKFTSKTTCFCIVLYFIHSTRPSQPLIDSCSLILQFLTFIFRK